jgi:diaminopimelate decarboxylase
MITSVLARDLVEHFGSPLYVYDLDEVARRAIELTAILPRCRIYYSLKANPFPEISRLLAARDYGAEVSSIGELRLAICGGFSPDAVLYTGPGKTPEELVAALTAGVRWFSCESWGDLTRMHDAASATALKANVLLRVRPMHIPRSRITMGIGTQFGFAEAALMRSLPNHAVPRNVEIAGLHYFLGSQIDDGNALLESFKAAVASARRLIPLLPGEARVVDLGGGFPWPYAQDVAKCDLSPVAAALPEVCSQLINAPELWFESGRFLVASAGTLVARIVDIKRSDNGSVVILDCGINALAGLPAVGRLMRPAITMRLVYQDSNRSARDTAPMRTMVTGPLCTPLDVLARNVEFLDATPGDLVLVPNVGAYGLTASLVAFLHRAAPTEVAIIAGTVAATRRLSISYADG